MNAILEAVERLLPYAGWYVWFAFLLAVLWCVFKKGAGRT
jgi:hypothetical protein